MRAAAAALFTILVLTGTMFLNGGCDTPTQALIFNPAFVNTTRGGIVPLAPGAISGFVLVRATNETQNDIEFLVTAEFEREVVNEMGESTVLTERETVRLQTFAGSQVNEAGVLFDCTDLRRIGLGEDLLRPDTEPGLFLGTIIGQVQGFAVPSGLNPLDMNAGNFSCGDTVIFQVAQAGNEVGGVEVFSFVLDGDTQPVDFVGPQTFENVRFFLEEQAQIEEEDNQ